VTHFEQNTTQITTYQALPHGKLQLKTH